MTLDCKIIRLMPLKTTLTRMASLCQLKPSGVSKHTAIIYSDAIFNYSYNLSETEKSGQKDFEFFLTRGNFLKVVDTLEKYQDRVVNTQSESGKEFIKFKRQLYMMYEVQNRSIDEHEEFSMQMERKSLPWLYEANEDYIG